MEFKQLTQKTLAEVAPKKLLEKNITLDGSSLEIYQRQVDLNQTENIVCIGLGKAASFQLKALYERFDVIGVPREKLKKGLSITKANHSVSGNENFDQIEGDHPFCGHNSVVAGEKLLDFVKNLHENTLVVFMLSGGASMLAVAPLTPFSLDEKINFNKKMILEGCPIETLNLFRKQMSQIKNGGLLCASAAKNWISLISVDVPSDEVFTVGSGPSIYKQSNVIDLEVLSKNWVEPHLAGFSKKFINYLHSKEWKSYQQYLDKQYNLKDHHVVVFSDQSLLKKNTIEILLQEGIDEILQFNEPLSQSVDDAVSKHVAVIERCLLGSRDNSFALVSTGECEVDVKGDGQGGRNTEFVLRLAQKLFENSEGVLSV